LKKNPVDFSPLEFLDKKCRGLTSLGRVSAKHFWKQFPQELFVDS